MKRSMTLAGSLAALAAATLVLGGCHSPKGGMMPASWGSTTYYSTESSPKSITIIDLRTDEPVFEMDIPVGKQLTFDFRQGQGDDPVHTPDLMRYHLFDIGTSAGRLRNSITVPPANVRRIDVHIRDGIEYRDPPDDQELRADELADRPDWWTPRGGPMPDESPAELYDR